MVEGAAHRVVVGVLGKVLGSITVLRLNSSLCISMLIPVLLLNNVIAQRPKWHPHPQFRTEATTRSEL